MTAQALVDELRACGVTLYRHHGSVRVVPASAVAADVHARIRANRGELLKILPDAPPKVAALRTRVGPNPRAELLPGHCLECDDILASASVAALCPACRRARNPDAVLFRLEVDRCAACGGRERWRLAPRDGGCSSGPWGCFVCHPPVPELAVERALGEHPPRYPLAVASEPVENMPAEQRRAIEADLTLLRVIVGRYSLIWDDDRELAAASALGERIDFLLARLAALGARVRVVPVS